MGLKKSLFGRFWVSFRTVFQQGQSNLVDPAEWPKIGFTKPDFWEHFVSFSQEKQQNTSSLNFLQSGPRKFTKSDFSGLAPIQRVLTLFF